MASGGVRVSRWESCRPAQATPGRCPHAPPQPGPTVSTGSGVVIQGVVWLNVKEQEQRPLGLLFSRGADVKPSSSQPRGKHGSQWGLGQQSRGLLWDIFKKPSRGDPPDGAQVPYYL